MSTSEKRVHDRINITDLGLVTFGMGASTSALAVRDLSYGGMLLPAGSVPKSAGAVEVVGRLRILDVEMPIRGHVAHVSSKGVGVMFDLSDEAAGAKLLETLRAFLDPTRYGKTMVPLAKSYVADGYKAPEWLVLQGLGPSVLQARYATAEHDELLEFSLTIRPGGYHVIEYRDGAVSIGSMQEGAGGFKSAVFAAGSGANRVVLRRAIAALSGVEKPQLAAKVAPMIVILRGALEVS